MTPFLEILRLRNLIFPWNPLMNSAFWRKGGALPGALGRQAWRCFGSRSHHWSRCRHDEEVRRIETAIRAEDEPEIARMIFDIIWCIVVGWRYYLYYVVLAMYCEVSSKVFELQRTTSVCLLLEPVQCRPRTSKGKSCVDLAVNANKKGSHHLVLSVFLGDWWTCHLDLGDSFALKPLSLNPSHIFPVYFTPAWSHCVKSKSCWGSRWRQETWRITDNEGTVSFSTQKISQNQ